MAGTSEEGFSLQLDAKHRVLLITLGESLTREIYWYAYTVVRRYIAAHGPCSAILDCSAVERFLLSNDFAHEIADELPVIPVPMMRVVVAPTRVIYGWSRIIETLRENTRAPINPVHTLKAAFTLLGTSAADFVPLDPATNSK